MLSIPAASRTPLAMEEFISISFLTIASDVWDSLLSLAKRSSKMEYRHSTTAVMTKGL